MSTEASRGPVRRSPSRLILWTVAGSALLLATVGMVGFASGLYLSFQNLPDVRSLDT